MNKKIWLSLTCIASLIILWSCHGAKLASPKISIITSVFNGDKFIEQFLEEIVKQTIFHECELIFINANSAGNEEKVILSYMQKYKNIVYLKLPYDPGLYAVWNMGIKLARGQYITNANLDDRVSYNCYEEHAKILDQNPSIDLVYSDLYITNIPNLRVDEVNDKTCYEFVRMPEFTPANMKESIPNDHPMWRKSCHERWGYFDEQYFAAGDFDLWLRFVECGAQFKKAHGAYGIHYANPKGLSTNEANYFAISSEVNQVKAKHATFLQSIEI